MQLKLNSLFALVLLVSVQLVGCLSSTELTSPRNALEGYVKESFNVRSIAQKATLESFLTGDTLQRLSTMTEEGFMTAFVDTKRKFVSMRIIENNKVSDSEFALTYEIAYKGSYAVTFKPKDKNGNEVAGAQQEKVERDALVTQRKMAMMIKVGSDWKISQVHSQRESIEYLSELSLP